MSKKKHEHEEVEEDPDKLADLPESKKGKDEPAKAAEGPVVHKGTLYSCVDGELTLMADESMQTPGAVYELAVGGELTINGKPYPLDDLKRGDKVVLEGDPVTKITATR